MKQSGFLVLLMLGVAPVLAHSADLIQPGKCIGRVCIGQTKPSVEAILGKPSITQTLPSTSSADASDLWIGSAKGGNQFLFVVYAKEKVVELHTSSSAFSTDGGISTACLLPEVRKVFRTGEESEYSLLFNGKNRYDWVVKKSGVTFSFAGDETGSMVMLTVHPVGQKKIVGYSQDEWYWYPKKNGKYVSVDRQQRGTCNT